MMEINSCGDRVSCMIFLFVLIAFILEALFSSYLQVLPNLATDRGTLMKV